MAQNKTETDSGVDQSVAAEVESLRARVRALEEEVRVCRLTGMGTGALSAREALLSEAERIAHLGSWFLDTSTNETKWSEELYRILGYDPARDVVSPEHFFQAIHPQDLPLALENMRILTETGVMLPADLRLVRKDGTVREIQCNGTVIRDGRGEVARVVGTVLDVTETRRAARFLKEVQSVAKVGSWVWDPGVDTLDVSVELRGIFGLEDGGPIKEDTLRAMVHPEDRGRSVKFRESMEASEPFPVELRIIRTDGDLRHILVQAKRLDDKPGKAHRILGTVLDITERKRLEEQLRQSQKMEVVGRVAGGVAHDFNNLLTVITGNAELILEDKWDERLLRIRDAAEVGAALTRQLLAFSRQAVVKPSALDLNVVIHDMNRVLERLIGEDISVKLELAGSPQVILADRGQVQQILLNLAVNARDAMAGGGDLILTTRETPGNPISGGGEPARWVELVVRDTGRGMDAITRQRALEPFFTTKEPGKGTGLGLSTIADVVAHMKGTIEIRSEPEQGTAVRIRFPHCALEVEPPPPGLAASRGGESILLVEDNAELRELVRMFLVGAGYKVIAVGRPGEAEAVWKSRGGGIDLLISDMVMPEKSGRELADSLTAVNPGLKVLFISGYSPTSTDGGGFLQKPFTRLELLDAVRAICDKPASAPPG